MKSTLQYSSEIYVSHLPLILLFSISFIIAFLIPAFASFPTYNDMGGIFLRLASVLTNLTPFTTAVITFSILLSLLFLSFAIVAINVIVKHSRTQTRIRKEVMDGLEKYTSRVFVVLLIYTVLVVLFNMLAYVLNASEVYAAVLSIVILPLFFYAPASIVVDEKGLRRAMQQSFSFFFKRLDNILLWFVAGFMLLSVFDSIFIAVGGAALSSYLILIFNSLFIMPFLVVLQSQSYMARFPMLKR